MKKCLLLIVILIVSQLDRLYAQSLIVGPTTVCVNQPVKFTTTDTTASSYYWGFCSGYLLNAPVGTNMGDNFHFKLPGNIEIIQDSGVYYGFVVNTMTREFLRLNYGNSLNNTPTVTNFGNMTNGVPLNPTSLYIVQEPVSRHWFIFVTGGYTNATSSLARIDFGPHLNNPVPNIANFGNHTGQLNFPKGIFVAQNPDGQWYGYLVNQGTSQLIRLDFSFNISNTPLMSNAGNPLGSLNFPTDLSAIRDNGKWYLFVANLGNNSIARLDLGTKLDTLLADIQGTRIDNGALVPDPTFNSRILVPSSITVTRDCGSLYAFVTDSTTSQLISIQMPVAEGPYNAIDYSVVGGMNFPSSISSIVRQGDALYGFITNAKDSTLTKIVFQQCNNSTIQSYSDVRPPVYSYNATGVYNVYFETNSGKPNMTVECRPVTVIPPPPLFKTPDQTICQGDTVHAFAVSNLADSIRWTTTYNIDTTYLYQDSARLYPGYNTSYHFTLYYPFGCIIDTMININVNQVTADAGPDRYIMDGAGTTLGGPGTTLGLYNYHWAPYQFLSDTTVPNPVANPPYDYTYYLTVTELNDGLQCSRSDTVVLHLVCGDFVLPNVFAPESANPGVNKFGLLNKEVSRLNSFRIYNRWGTLVFETTDPTQGWDGTYKDQPAQQGVYVWVAEGFCISGKKLKKQGNVTLLR